MNIPVSVVISAYNEEHHIRRVLESVSWAKEIIVVDNESADKTPLIAKDLGAKVISRPNNPMLNKNKNIGFLEAHESWILNLDADEAVTPELAKEIAEILKEESSTNGYWIPRKNIIFGKWIKHGLWWPDKQLRLFRKGSGKFPCIHVHEYIRVEGETNTLESSIEHLNYETISQFFTKLNTIYTENEAAVRDSDNVPFSWHQFIRDPLSDFANVYLAKGGYKDGIHGLVLAILQAIYAFTIVAKRWEKRGFPAESVSLSQFHHELSRGRSDVAYWYYTVNLESEKNPFKRLFLRILRKYAASH